MSINLVQIAINLEPCLWGRLVGSKPQARSAQPQTLNHRQCFIKIQRPAVKHRVFIGLYRHNF
jgi:hypothetical protein